MRTLFLAILVTSISSLGACKKSTDSATPRAVDTPRAQATDGDHGDEPSKLLGTGRVAIEPRLAAMCSLTEPNFDFDSSALSYSARGTLDTLAECMLDGAAKDHDLQLVGHADPRGDEEYNLGLGQRRATEVASYLQRRGVSYERMVTSSRGELDATGTNEATWGPDRRVDIALTQ